MLLWLAACAGALLVPGVSWLWGVDRECVCRVDLAGAPEPSGAILDLLRAQLERCGPGQLQCPPCPSCPSVDCRSGGLLEGLGWFFTGLLLGLLVASLPRGQAAATSVATGAGGAPSPPPALTEGGQRLDELAREVARTVRTRRALHGGDPAAVQVLPAI